MATDITSLTYNEIELFLCYLYCFEFLQLIRMYPVTDLEGELDGDHEIIKDNRSYSNDIDLEIIVDKCVVSIKLIISKLKYFLIWLPRIMKGVQF